MKFATVDLFAGCGGMSLGFEMAGFTSVVAVERDEWAASTYRANHPDVTVIQEDVTHLRDESSLRLDGRRGEADILGVIGGPPCQGFSLSGDRDPKDPRNSLFMDFIRVVSVVSADFFVMENVTGLLSMRTANRRKVVDIIQEVADEARYATEVLRLTASDFGVPQNRERVFVIGIREGYPFAPSGLHPLPTTPGRARLTVDDAISDLPELKAGEGSSPAPYTKDPVTDYQRWAREGSGSVWNHVAMRHTDRLVRRFQEIDPGMSVKDMKGVHAQRQRGNPQVASGKAFGQNNMRVFGDRPAPTIPASFQSNFIHPTAHRNFTAREGARIQSFPDSYVFQGERTVMSWEKRLSQYQQIGNAVPPLLASAIGSQLVRYFKRPLDASTGPARFVQDRIKL